MLSLEGFGLSGKPAAAAAAGAILYYVRSTQRGTFSHVDRIGFYERQTCLVLDAVTVRNLELIEPLFAGTDAGVTLFRSVDATVTPMGKRLLRSWLLRPSIDLAEINARLDAVESQVKETIAREELRRALDGILDLERLLSRVTLETANPRDVLALAASLAKLPAVRKALERVGGTDAHVVAADSAAQTMPVAQVDGKLPNRLATLHSSVDELADLRQRIESTIIPEPPISLSDGGVIQPGVDPELDELRDLSRNSKQFLAQIEQRERQRTGIASLKVKFNSIFGYYLEISKANPHLAPPDYERKQTLVNAERFTTPELKEYESKILDAQEKIVDIERRLFAELRSAIAGEARRIRQTALALAEIDVLAALAQIAALRNYCRPKFDDSADIEIVAGRHPVIEQLELGSGDRFVPNDLFLNSTTNAIMVLTGPNMGGKSTYLRQAALTVIMAQMGSFVPARSARLGVVDRVFTRIGASDNLARGRSTFMVEMTETAAILHTATPRSLDPARRSRPRHRHLRWPGHRLGGRRIHPRPHPGQDSLRHALLRIDRTGRATLRRQELSRHGERNRWRNRLPAQSRARRGRPQLRHRSREAGRTSPRSHRARPRSAGRARKRRTPVDGTPLARLTLPPAAQLTIFTPLSQPVLDKLREVDLNSLTPLEALNLLAQLKKQVE